VHLVPHYRCSLIRLKGAGIRGTALYLIRIQIRTSPDHPNEKEHNLTDISAKARAMSTDQKVAYLKSKGWVRDRGSLWASPNGFTSPLANAVRLQLLADLGKES
jgi:hypothetical protein